MLISTHCHSHYSFDCDVPIEKLVMACVDNKINSILITDHDVFGLTACDLKKFDDRNIVVLNAIEFTVQEGAHIIGVHPQIKKFEKSRCSYKAVELVSALKNAMGWVIIPHPSHQTGLLSSNLSNEDLEYCLSNAHFIEKESSKYGKFDIGRIVSKYNNLSVIVSDDAHMVSDIGIMTNQSLVDDEVAEDKYEAIFSGLKKGTRPHYNYRRLFMKRFRAAIFRSRIYMYFSPKISRDMKEKLRRWW